MGLSSVLMILAKLNPSKTFQYPDAFTQVETKNSKSLDYVEDIAKLKLIIGSKRKENWNLHLLAVGRMQNTFTVSWDFNYAGSARIYLQWILGFINSSQSTGFILFDSVTITRPACHLTSLLNKW